MTPQASSQRSKHVLVVANLTAVSDELLSALETLAHQRPTAFTLIAPGHVSERERATDHERLEAALERLRAAGLQVEGRVVDSDPIVAVSEAWDPRRFDQIVVSTLPVDISKWLSASLPKRISDLTGALVFHVVCEPPAPPLAAAPPRPHQKSALGPLSVLGWGRHS